jgi:hypothetical protein
MTKFVFIMLFSGHFTISTPMDEASCNAVKAKALEKLHLFYPVTPVKYLETTMDCQAVTGTSEK